MILRKTCTAILAALALAATAAASPTDKTATPVAADHGTTDPTHPGPGPITLTLIAVCTAAIGLSLRHKRVRRKAAEHA